MREIRESEYECPQCGHKLTQVWAMRDTGTLAGGKEMQPLSRPACPQGHRLEWTLAGPV